MLMLHTVLRKQVFHFSPEHFSPHLCQKSPSIYKNYLVEHFEDSSLPFIVSKNAPLGAFSVHHVNLSDVI